ncbi:MAG: hypothetical protein LBU27_06685 [Candidatus Peribacteria bacterium]|jgi:hypothetical protein|nr:hypothetical protein [Candidatus Peribacteria bacterium]
MTEKEIKQRLQNIETRHIYTDELQERGIKDGLEYALLTNISYQWSGKTSQEYKEYKGLTKNDNLRDHMTRTEMILTGLSEEAGSEIVKSRDAQGFMQVQDALVAGSDIAKKARQELEEKTGKTVLDTHNRLTPKQKISRKEALQQQNHSSKGFPPLKGRDSSSAE